jgi:diguanylate cyclase (GGDEF)-like protein
MGGRGVKDKIKIMVVDDELIIREMLKEHLTEEGYTVTTVSSGEDALEIFKDDPDYMVITDIRMGGMSGVQLLEEVRKLDSEAVVIIITSHASLDSAVETMRAGAYDYIFKPFEDLDQITQIVMRAMDKIELLHENRVLMENLAQNNLRMEQSNETLRELATRDGLTGLFNHRHFKEVLDRELTRAGRYQRPLCLIMVDVDHFKDYNDTHGHPAGDYVLKTLAQTITFRLRDVDTCARYGGEEFAILLPETALASGRVVSEEIRTQVEGHDFEGRETQPLGKITISLGIAEFPANSDDAASLIKKADEALYRAKHEGRNLTVSADEF